MSKELIIVISGQICRDNSANLRNFWRGFINIQRSVSGIDGLKIVAHSWNPEFDALVKEVYKPFLIKSEKQTSFFVTFINTVKSLDKYQKGIERSSSIWKGVSFQTVLGNSFSRSKAIGLLNNEVFQDDTQVLVTRWDQGCSGSKDVNVINYDSSLNEDYLYLAYYSEIDEGYADMWLVGGVSDILLFEQFGQYVLKSLGGENDYFKNFTNDWLQSLPRVKRKYKKEQFLKKSLKIGKIFLPFFKRKINKYLKKLSEKIEAPVITAENYYPLGFKSGNKFPNYQALNIHALLKSFILDKDLRSKTRFLAVDDFEKYEKGTMINSKPFVYCVYSHSSFSDCWEMAISQAYEHLPSNCQKVYLMSDASEKTMLFYKALKKRFDVELVTYDDEDNYTKRLHACFSEINKQFDIIYFVHEDMPLTDKVDQVYLNALLHYLNYSNEFYIKLVDTIKVNKKEEHPSFPELNRNYGGYSLSVQPSLIKLADFLPLLDSVDENIYDFEKLCVRSNMTFSAVVGDKKVGLYALCNDKFPHIVTAIVAGKWCRSEWSDEINYLAEKYDIDLSVRGER